MKECAERADVLAKQQKLIPWRFEGDIAPTGWVNHYNPRYERCYMLVTYLCRKSKESAQLKIPVSSCELYDAFEARLLSSCTPETNFTDGLFCTIQGKDGFNCDACRQFIEDRLDAKGMLGALPKKTAKN